MLLWVFLFAKYRTISDDCMDALILRHMPNILKIANKKGFFVLKNPCKLVAGVGFEPTTFRL